MKKNRYEVGSGNVFQDLDIPNAEEHLIKAQLVYRIHAVLKSRRLKQAQAAALLGIKQPDVSKMLRGQFRQFSVERLLRFLVALGHDVEIKIKSRRRSASLPDFPPIAIRGQNLSATVLRDRR